MSVQLCLACRTRAVPGFRKVFSDPNVVDQRIKQMRIQVGNILDALNSEDSCDICRFFVDTLQLRTRDNTYKIHRIWETDDETEDHGYRNREDFRIYLATDSDPWYCKAGIATESPACPFAWLQIGSVVEEPLICVSLEPIVQDIQDPMPLPDRVYPRRRPRLEAYNGTIYKETIRGWLRKCESHQPQCYQSPVNLPGGFMLIDVERRCLQPWKPGDQYLTLSYVWGKGAAEQAFWLKPDPESTQVQLVFGAGMILPRMLPKTIEDALFITKSLNQRFLWVDLFCINQGNRLEKQAQIDAMDTIFASSWLTLVCMNGPTADYGLTGASRYMSQTWQPVVSTPIGRLMATHVHSHWDHNGDCEWNQRAWTLQEHLLSPRCLFFADTYCSMTCRAEFFHDLVSINIDSPEVVLQQDQTFFREDGSSIDLDLEQWSFDAYGNLVSVFTGRNLTDLNDVHNACRGALKRIAQRSGVSFHFGLPKDDLQQGLLWVPHQYHVPTRRHGFPSWSWLGWVGRCEYPYWLHNWNTTDRPFEPSQHTQRRLEKDKNEFFQNNTMLEAQSVHDITMTAPVIQLRTMVRIFEVQLLWQSGVSFRPSPLKGFQQAIGDQWALITPEHGKLLNPIGEDQYFGNSHVYFRLHPEQSIHIQRQNCKVELVFVKYWSYIWDAKGRKHNIVSALVVFRDKDGSYNRLGCVAMPAAAWLAADGQGMTVTIV